MTRILIGIYFLAHEYQPSGLLGDKFGVGASTAHLAITDFMHAMRTLESGRLQFSWSGLPLKAISDTFYDSCHLLNVAGAIDCTHIVHCKPTDALDPVAYWDRNGRYSTIAQVTTCILHCVCAY